MKTVKHFADLSAFLLLAPVLLRGETIQECINRTTSHSNSGEDVIEVHTEDKNRTFNLYESNNGLTWCDSFMKCKEKGQHLAVVHDRSTQEFLLNSSLYKVTSGDAWVAGRRKDFGNNWTWLSDEMTPYEDKLSLNCKGPDPRCRMTVISETVNLNSGAQVLTYFICANSEPEKRAVSWYEAMNACADIQGRLAVYPEVVDNDGKFRYHTKKVRSYWVGLYYKPWIWILGANSSVAYLPVYHSFWENVSNAEQFSDEDRCLAVQANSGKWLARSCKNILNHYICQSTSAELLDISGQSTTTHQKVVTDKAKASEKNTKGDIIPTKVGIESTTREERVSNLPNVRESALKSWIVVITSAPVSVSGLILLVSVCVMICFCKSRKKDIGKTGISLVSLSQDDTFTKSKKNTPLGNPQAEHEYSFLRDSKIYTKPKKLKPHLPPRDQTYNQPYEDTRLETESGTETETETDLGNGVEQTEKDTGGVYTSCRMNTGNETWKSEQEYLYLSQNAQPENDDGPERGEVEELNTLACIPQGPIGKITNGLKTTLINNRLISNDVRDVLRPNSAFY